MMPTLLVQTSQKVDDSTRKQLLRDASKAVATTLKKPEEYVMVSFKTVDDMMFGGSDEPCAFVHLASIGRIGPDTNPAMSKVICELVEKYLGVPANRVYIQFYDSPAANFGYDGSTFG
jgi:phenylpyruvate tautomerase